MQAQLPFDLSPASALTWDDFRFLLCVARLGTLSAAARHLEIEISTALRRLNAIEARIGGALFLRDRRGYVPTPQGEILVEAADAMARSAVDAMRRVNGVDERVAGTVRLATSELISVYLLPTLLPALREALPAVEIEVTVSNSPVDLTRREADLALRATAKPAAHLVGRRVAEVRYGVFASPSLLEPLGDGPIDLGSLPWLGFDERLRDLPNARWMREHVPDETVVLRFDAMTAMLRSAGAGLGALVAPLFGGASEGRLVQLGAALPISSMPLWVLRHPDAGSARVRAVFNHLCDHVPIVVERLERTLPSCGRPVPALCARGDSVEREETADPSPPRSRSPRSSRPESKRRSDGHEG